MSIHSVYYTLMGLLSHCCHGDMVMHYQEKELDLFLQRKGQSE